MVPWHQVPQGLSAASMSFECGMEGAACESEEFSLYSLRSLDASALLGALAGALLPSEDIFCHTQAAAELSLETHGQWQGHPHQRDVSVIGAVHLAPDCEEAQCTGQCRCICAVKPTLSIACGVIPVLCWFWH